VSGGVNMTALVEVAAKNLWILSFYMMGKCRKKVVTIITTIVKIRYPVAGILDFFGFTLWI
jgi:hypothetical protein